MKRSIAAAVLLCAFTGCGDSPGEAACDTFVAEFVDKAADECMLGTRREIEDSLFLGFRMVGIDSCSDVDRVRDERAFYDECIPFIQTTTCAELTTLPAACMNQLIIER